MYQSTEFSRALDIILSNLPKIGFRNVKALELGVLLRASEDTEDALKIMADVRAYFQGMPLDSLQMKFITMPLQYHLNAL